MKYFKRILLIITFSFICLVVIGSFLPTNYTVTRSIIIDSTPDKIHHYVGELNNWHKWSPWIENDPTLKITVGEKTNGIGASQSWEGKDGAGSLVFTATEPHKGVEYDLEFSKAQFECDANFKYISKGEQTEVIWTMNGKVKTPIIGGFFARKVDSFIGPDFEKGLSNLKSVVEANN